MLAKYQANTLRAPSNTKAVTKLPTNTGRQATLVLGTKRYKALMPPHSKRNSNIPKAIFTPGPW